MVTRMVKRRCNFNIRSCELVLRNKRFTNKTMWGMWWVDEALVLSSNNCSIQLLRYSPQTTVAHADPCGKMGELGNWRPKTPKFMTWNEDWMTFLSLWNQDEVPDKQSKAAMDWAIWRLQTWATERLRYLIFKRGTYVVYRYTTRLSLSNRNFRDFFQDPWNKMGSIDHLTVTANSTDDST